MEGNRNPMAKTLDGAGPSEAPETGKLRQIEISVEVFKRFKSLMEFIDEIEKVIDLNTENGRWDLNPELVPQRINGIKEVRQLLIPILTEVNKVTEEVELESSVDYVTSEVQKILARTQPSENEARPILNDEDWAYLTQLLDEKISKKFLRKGSVCVPLRGSETTYIGVQKEYIRVILESEKKRKIPNYEEEDKALFYAIEIAEKTRNLTPWTVEQKINHVKNSTKHEREIQRPVLMDVEEVPFSALREDGPMRDLLTELIQIFYEITDIIGDPTRQLEKEVLVECTRSCLRRIKQQLDKERLTITID